SSLAPIATRCCAGTCSARSAGPVSERSPVDLDRLERSEVDSVEAADVDRRDLRPRRMLAERERRRAARRAEPMLDAVPVERVRREVLLAALEPHAFARHAPEQIALAAAMRAVAVDNPIDLALDLVGDLAAVTAPGIRHSIPPSAGRTARTHPGMPR